MPLDFAGATGLGSTNEVLVESPTGSWSELIVARADDGSTPSTAPRRNQLLGLAGIAVLALVVPLGLHWRTRWQHHQLRQAG
ncbi:hypothetical protein [Aquihabitans sp. McL0605]|uniref:hypothetical protein n=1 Tax=Aquihabitans sp. McL0605 TaxID=3415671 RepID=UPI003CEF266C